MDLPTPTQASTNSLSAAAGRSDPAPTGGAALLLVLIQVVINNFVEPTLTGRGADLSPLVTLIALSFWGFCWGLTGMRLAVPLTAVLKIVWENLAFTRPLAILMAEGDG